MSIRRPGGLLHEETTHSIIGAFYTVHGELQFGLLESSYVSALERELRKRGHKVEREVQVRVYYKGELIGWQRIDMLVDRKVVLECKAALHLSANAGRQLYAYLKATEFEVGLVLHFGLKATYYRVYCPNKNDKAPSPGNPEKSE